MMRPLSSPRPLQGIVDESSGQLATEWVLLTATVVIPVIALMPQMIHMIYSYYQRITEVISIPFP